MYSGWQLGTVNVENATVRASNHPQERHLSERIPDSNATFNVVITSACAGRTTPVKPLHFHDMVAEMLKPRGQTGLEAKIFASASGPFGLGLKLLVSASNFNI